MRSTLPILLLLNAALACGPLAQPRTPTPDAAASKDAAKPEAASPAETAVEARAEVIDSSWYQDAAGKPVFIGLLRNSGDIDLQLVEVIVTLRDGSGVVVSTETGFTVLDVVRAGETAPFQVLFFNDPGTWTEYEIAVQAYPATGILHTYRDFDVLSVQVRAIEYGRYVAAGELLNSGQSAAQYVQVTVMAFDAPGRLIGFASGYAALNALAPGETSPFEVTFYEPLNGEIDHVETIVEGILSE